MQLSIKQDQEFTIVTILENRLDASIAPEFKTQMEGIIQQDLDQIILDISNVEFMDSSSLGVMVVILKKLGTEGSLVLSGASGVVLELFKLTRMNKVFTLVDNLNEAKKVLV